MIRFTWLQFRAQAAVAFGALAVVAVILAVTGPRLVHLYDTTIATCQARHDCSLATSAFVTNDHFLQLGLDSLLLAVPALLGIFWGAPLVARELENGTFRLAWTQGVTRKRWLAARLGLVGLSSTAVAGLLSLIATWWYSPLDRVNANQFSSATFGIRDIVPVGYAAFAFALGVTAGMVIRRTLPAMATTLVAFAGARLAMTYWVRPHLMTPIRVTSAFRAGQEFTASGASGLVSVVGAKPGAWVYSSYLVNFTGHPVTPAAFQEESCSNSSAALQACAAKFREVLIYQPPSRYWAFQWYEAAIFLGLSLILAGLCFWWIRRRLS